MDGLYSAVTHGAGYVGGFVDGLCAGERGLKWRDAVGGDGWDLAVYFEAQDFQVDAEVDKRLGSGAGSVFRYG